MKPSEFLSLYTEYFGESVPLPIAVVYSDEILGEYREIQGCMFKQLHYALSGKTVSLSADNFTCGGGKLYAGIGPIQERIFNFVSKIEKYKKSPEVAHDSIKSIAPAIYGKKYLNLIRIDKLETFHNAEGLIFVATPDILSGLFTWANYDQSDINSVQAPWGSGCSTSITSIVNENRKGGKHCFIGMLDVSARPYFRYDTLSFSIPMSRFIEMCHTLSDCCVSGAPAWLKVRKRINRAR